MRHQWNTKRLYSEHGQRITARTISEWIDGEFVCGIVFKDMDRGITGFIPRLTLPEYTYKMEDYVMFNYDRGNYKSDWFGGACLSNHPDMVWV